MKRTLLLTVLLAAFGAISASMSSVRADIYASDDFSSDSIGSSAAGGGTGFTGDWSLSSYDGATSSSDTIVSGLTLSGVNTSGNAVEISSTNGGASLDRAFGSTIPADGNLWGSFVFSQQSLVNNNGYGQDATVTGTKFTIPGDGNRQYFANALDDSPYSTTNYGDIGLYKNNNAYGSYSLTTGQTYFVVYDFSNIGYGAYTGNTTTEDLWVLSQANLTAIGGNFTTANLNANNVLDLTFNSGAGGETYGTSVITPSSVFSLVGQAGTADFGNIVLGSTLADVASDATVPEPSAWVLILGGLVALITVQRKRSMFV